MASIEIFEDQAFSVTTLTAAINEQPFKPGRIGELGLFSEQGITTLTAQIEYDGSTLGLVSAQPRGSVGESSDLGERKLLPINTVHLPKRDTMYADEVQGIRAFGSQTELEVAQVRVNRYLAKHRQDLDVTHEYHRVGAINGKILDADGKKGLLDVYKTFGITKTELSMGLNSADTNLRLKCDDALELIEKALGATYFRGGRALCGKEFWQKLISHPSVEKTYLNTSQAAELRGAVPDSFDFGGIVFERYRGSVGDKAFIPDGEARLYPEGVSDFFITRFSPADYMETVNTEGLPYYSRVEPLRFGKGLEIESQSNPIHVPTRPKAIVHLKL